MSDTLVRTPPAGPIEIRKKFYTLETDLTAEEIALLDAAEEEFKEFPQNFISLEDFMAGKRI